jgi:hypothetical protein
MDRIRKRNQTARVQGGGFLGREVDGSEINGIDEDIDGRARKAKHIDESRNA